MILNRLYSFLMFSLAVSIFSLSWSDEEPVRIRAVGYFLDEDEGDVADRDSDIPSLYDKNRMNLMRQRDRWLLRHGKCCPPPGVLVSPSITMPPERDGEFYKYDPRNRRYRDVD